MLNYIATENTSKLIKKICKEKNILILYKTENTTNISNYLKETKINFNLIKYFIIEISCLDNLEEEIIQSIYNFNRLHTKTRIIILAQGFNEQSNLLNELYKNEIYNIINSTDKSQIEQQLIKALSLEGIQQKEAKRFKKIEEISGKNNQFEKIKKFILSKNKKDKDEKKNVRANNLQEKNKIEKNTVIHQSGGVYFFALLIEAITRLVKLICYILVFLLTSIGITIILNSQLRDMVFQIFGLK